MDGSGPPGETIRGDVSQYIDSMSNTGQPLDQIAVIAMAHMYHIHIGIIMDGWFWTSRRDHKLDACKILLGWQGKLSFVDIKWKNQAQVQLYNLRKPRYPDGDLGDLTVSPKPRIKPDKTEPRYDLSSKTPDATPGSAPAKPVDFVFPQPLKIQLSYNLCSSMPAARK